MTEEPGTLNSNDSFDEEWKDLLEDIFGNTKEITFDLVYNPAIYADAAITLDDEHPYDMSMFENGRKIKFYVEEIEIEGIVIHADENKIYFKLTRKE